MNIGELVKGIKGIETVIAKHEVTIFDDSLTLATFIKTHGEQVNHQINGRGNKPKVNSRYATMLLRFHSCTEHCYLNPEFIEVVETNDPSLDYGDGNILEGFGFYYKRYYERQRIYQPNPESDGLSY